MRAVIVTGKLVQDHEFLYPYYRLQEAGYAVDVAVRGKQPCQGIIGVKIEPTIDVPEIATRLQDLLIIPGGVKAMEHMRLDTELAAAIAMHHRRGGVIGAICSAALLLISAGLVRGRTVSCYQAWQVDVENAGGTWAPGVCDFDRIVTAPHYRDLGPWMAAVLKAVEKERANA